MFWIHILHINIGVRLYGHYHSARDWTDRPAVVEEEEAALPGGGGALDGTGAGGQHHGGPAQSFRENNYNFFMENKAGNPLVANRNLLELFKIWIRSMLRNIYHSLMADNVNVLLSDCMNDLLEYPTIYCTKWKWCHKVWLTG